MWGAVEYIVPDPEVGRKRTRRTSQGIGLGLHDVWAGSCLRGLSGSAEPPFDALSKPLVLSGSTGELADLNGVRPPNYVIHPGQRITVPGCS